MDEKKQEILNLALLFFKEDPRAHDHIDEIVKYCRMSKATFYHLFGTKENFLMELIHYTERVMINEIDRITFAEDMPVNQKFEKKIVSIITYWSLIVRFRSFLFSLSAFGDRDSIVKERQKSLETLYGLYQTMLIELYGEEVNAYIWDMVFQLNAYVNVFIQIKFSRLKHFDEALMTRLILSVLQALKDRLMINGGMLDRSLLFASEQPVEEAGGTGKSALYSAVGNIKAAIRTQELNLDRSKLMLAAQRIEDEVKSGENSSYITDAMVALLEKETALRDLLVPLKKCLSQLIAEPHA